MKKYHVEFQFISADGRLTDENGREKYLCVEWMDSRELKRIKGYTWIKILNVKEMPA